MVQDYETLEIAKEQPYIHRLCRLGQAAENHGRGLAFADEVSQVIWSGKVDDWHKGDHLSEASTRAGLEFSTLETEAVENASALDAEIASNQAKLEAAGHWGVPCLVFDDEPFFGQDRIEMAKWRMKQSGLTHRGA